MVWCSAATVDGDRRPRSRVLHPIWEGSTGWITTDRQSLKARHLREHPYVSLAYVSEPFKPAYADCLAQWEDDETIQRHVWDLLASTPSPLGFDPATIYARLDGSHSDLIPFGLLKLIPYRVVLTQFPEPVRLWTPVDENAWFTAHGVRAE
jgi:hypothetical protein